MKRIRRTSRTRALEQYADQSGMRFELKDSFGLVAYFRDMKLFKQGGDRHGRHLMQREAGLFEHWGAMDYYYTVSTGKTSHTLKQSVYFRVSNTFMLPAFHMFPEKWYHRVGKWFGMQDIDFIAYPEFSKYYLLQGAQPQFIERFFEDDRLIRHFTEYRGWSVEAVGKYFVMYHPDMLVPPAEMESFFYIGDRLHQLLADRNASMEDHLRNE
jgi:hypothetical protein